MERRQPPVRVISLGRVYRPDTADATHYPMFHQMEGLLVDRPRDDGRFEKRAADVRHSYLGEEVHIRFRPSFFPFTEPSVEVDMRWHDRWIEFGAREWSIPTFCRRRLRPEDLQRLRLRPGYRKAVCSPTWRDRHSRILSQRCAVPACRRLVAAFAVSLPFPS